MCGIAGLVDPSGAKPDRALLERMTRRLAPRGPDGEGFFLAPGVGLGHARLKVIDLSDAAAQPMASDDGALRLVFNGEIYNFRELRADLEGRGHRFRSQSDTEAILRGYEAWGDDVLDRFEGMFAFALWDGRRRRLLAARDRMGKKPLYFAEVPRPGAPALLAFASELKALAPVPGLDRSVDPEAFARYLVFEYVPAPRSIFRGARKLDAAEKLTVEVRDGRAHVAVGRWWRLPLPGAHAPRGAGEAAEELRAILGRAVRRRLVADVPLGVFLSGGLDSSAVTALAAREGAGGRVATFSIGFSEPSFDESVHARRVADHVGTAHHEERLDPHVLVDVLPEVVRFLDEPLGDASIIPTYLLARFTRRHVTVALGGDGGDELFAGYPTLAADRLAGLFFDPAPRVAKSALATLARWLPARADYFSLDFKLGQFLRGADARGPRRHQRWMASFLPEELPGLLAAPPAGDPIDDVDRTLADLGDLAPADRVMAFYCRSYLAGDINPKVDRATGAVGLEPRAPFLDSEVVRFACSLPAKLRMRGITSKWILRRAMRGLLPDDIIDRRKQGFGVPVARWMKGELLPMLRDQLAPAKIRREGFFRPEAVTALVDDHVSGRRDRRKALWTLLSFENWLAEHGPAAQRSGNVF